MMRKLNIIVENLLQKRYNEKYLVEKLDDGGMPTRSGKAKKAEDIKRDFVDFAQGVERDYADWAYENIPGVKGMAQVEVPLASKNKKEYETLRTELAKEIVKARKAAFDKKESADEKEILLRALGENPQLANVLTRDEYESIAGEITNPLELNFEVEDETGAKTPKSISLPKWSGIEDNSAMLYDFLRGAQHSLTTPEGLATAGAYGAAFRGLGLGAGALGRVLGPKLAKYVPGLVKQATKVTLPQRARSAAGVGQALGQQAVNVTGLGLMGLGGLQAAQQGKFSRYAGELAGGVAPFAAGSKAVDVAVPVAAKGLPIAYAKGKEAATAVGDIAKGTGESLAQLGKKVGSDISGAAQDVKNLSVKDLLANLKAGLTPSGLDFSYQIRRSVPSEGFQNLTPAEQVAAWRRGESTWSPGQEFSPYFEPGRSSTSPGKDQPRSLAGRAAAAATTAAVSLGSAQTSPAPMLGSEVGARIGAIETGVGAPKVETSPFKVDLSGSGGRATSETGAKATQTTPAASTAKSTPAAASQGVRTFAQVDAVKKSETTKVGQEKPSEDVPGKDEEKTQDQTDQGQDQKQETKDTTTDQAKQRNVDYIRNTIGSVGPGGPPLAPPNRVPEPPPPGKGGGGGGLPGFGMGGVPQGSPISDYEMKRQMAGTDINAILQNLFQTARTVTIG
jgi:hypothetical protein